MAKKVEFLKGSPLFLPLNPLDDVLIHGEVVGPQAQSVPVLTPEGLRMVFKGEFVLSGSDVTSGTITGFDLYVGSTKVMKAQGFAVSVTDVKAAFDAAHNMSDTSQFYRLFFADAKLAGSKTDDVLVGYSGSKALGRDGNDNLIALEGVAVLKGGDGDDLLRGNGMSSLVGNDGNDVFVFNDTLGGADRIKDFSVKCDFVALDTSGTVPLGFLSVGYFHIGKAAETPDQHVIYDKQTGGLYWDQDGSGTIHSAVQIAILPDHLKLKADNIFIVG
jgi:Ca2+-binding RTX toxin-like protein